MEAITLTITLTEEYAQALKNAKGIDRTYKGRNWPELLKPVDGCVRFALEDSTLTLSCTTAKGEVRERCSYESIQRITELRSGVLLQLAKGKLLFLHAGKDRLENEKLMQVIPALFSRCKYLFKHQNIRLPGVSPLKRLNFYLRKPHGYRASVGPLKAAVAVLMALCLLIGTVFVAMPFLHRKIDEKTAEKKIVLLSRYEAGKELYLYDSEGDCWSVDNCCVDTALLAEVRKLPVNAGLELLLRPGTKAVLQITVNSKVLLDFEEAQDRIFTEAVTFAVFGAAMYFAGGYMIVLLVRKKKGMRP